MHDHLLPYRFLMLHTACPTRLIRFDMDHSFDIGTAEEYGVIPAILVKNFQFWIIKNKANLRHQYEGRTWTYNSIKAMGVIFPYLTEDQIRYALKHLVDKGILLTGNFNQDPRDRTLWYAFANEGEFLFCISENPKPEFEILQNDYKDTDNKLTDSKLNKKINKKGKLPTVSLAEFEKENGRMVIAELEDWIKEKQLDPQKVARELDHFRNQCQAKGYSYVNYYAAFKTWQSRNGLHNLQSRHLHPEPPSKPKNVPAFVNQVGFSI